MTLERMTQIHDRTLALLYLIARDKMPAGDLEALVAQCTTETQPGPIALASSGLAAFAAEMLDRLKDPTYNEPPAPPVVVEADNRLGLERVAEVVASAVNATDEHVLTREAAFSHVRQTLDVHAGYVADILATQLAVRLRLSGFDLSSTGGALVGGALAGFIARAFTEPARPAAAPSLAAPSLGETLVEAVLANIGTTGAQSPSHIRATVYRSVARMAEEGGARLAANLVAELRAFDYQIDAEGHERIQAAADNFIRRY